MTSQIEDLRKKARSLRIIQTLLTSALFALTGVVYGLSSQNIPFVLLYIVLVLLVVGFAFIRVNRAEDEIERKTNLALEESDRLGWARRRNYEHAAEAIAPSQFQLLAKLAQELQPGGSKNESEFTQSFINDLLEDITTRVFEADTRAIPVKPDEWAGQTFKSTLMTKQLFTEAKFKDFQNLMENNTVLTDDEKRKKIEARKRGLDKSCLLIEHWYYPGGGHPGSLGIPYEIRQSVAGFAWASKSLVVWTPEGACTTSAEVPPTIFVEAYKGQQGKYQSMVCLVVESLDKQSKFLPSSDKNEDGVLGVLTLTCERPDYFVPKIGYAKFLLTLLAPYVSIFSFALERLALQRQTAQPSALMKIDPTSAG